MEAFGAVRGRIAKWLLARDHFGDHPTCGRTECEAPMGVANREPQAP